MSEAARSSPRALVVLGVPENRRVRFALAAAERLGWAPPVVLAWREFLARPASLEDALEQASQCGARPTTLRVDSPGEDWDTERALLALGAEQPDPQTELPAPERISAEEARSLAPDRGRIFYPRQWYLGFRAALDELARRASRAATVTAPPDDVACLFDKRATHERLQSDGVPTPALLGCPRDSDALRALLRARDERRVFVKLWHGSSASGVVALRWDRAGPVAITSAELSEFGGRARLYNSLRVRRYADEREARAVLDALLREGCVVERWEPKAAYEGDNFDLRVVTIAGRARHAVVRVGRSPMTNLHLGNRRGDLDRLRARLGPARWSLVTDAAERCARAFSRSHALGVDVMLSSDLRRALVIEANAFGDLLPNVENEGDDTYTAELRAL